MALYSFQGSLPAPLPSRIRLANGLTRTNPSTYSAKEIKTWGYIGPITIPSWDEFSEKIEWDEAAIEYTVRPLTAEEFEAKRLERARQMINYAEFYNRLIFSSSYQAIRGQAEQNIALTVASTEFIAAMTDAKLGRPNEMVIQACIDRILSLATLNDDEAIELSDLMRDFHLSELYQIVINGQAV